MIHPHTRRLALLGTLLLAACAQPQTTRPAPVPIQATPAPSTPVGAPVTLTFSGLGTPHLNATLTTSLSPQGLTDQQGTVTPVRVLGRGTVDVIPAGQPRTSGYRYVYAIVSVTSTTALSNVSFLGVRTQDTLPAGTHDTAISNLNRVPGAASYTPTEAAPLSLSVRPTQASTVNPTTGQLQVLPNTTDTVQYLPENELFVPAGMIGLLPYGFTVLNTAQGRTLSLGGEANRMVVGMKIPLQARPQDDPYGFAFTAIPVSDSVTRVTQTLEGRQSGDSLLVKRRAESLGAQLTVLPGSPLNGSPLLEVRTGGEVGAVTGQLFSPVNVVAGGVNSTVIARDEGLTVRFRQAPTGMSGVVTRGKQSVVKSGEVTISGDMLTVPARVGGYFPGEGVEVSLTRPLGAVGLPRVFRYRTATSSASGRFSGGQNISVGGDPVGVAVGDVDGDGDLDLLSANYSSHSVSVRVNNGTGTFSGAQQVGVGTSPSSLEIGDVDGDGDLDLLSANYSSATVSVRVNNGTGTFSGAQEVGVGTSPGSLALGDVDGDGDLDLLSASYTGTTISVRLNNGTGAFIGTQEVRVGSRPSSVTVEDVDGDGDLDLLSSSAGRASVSVRVNDGLGTFSGTQEVGVGSFPLNVTVGDVDGDGDLDLLSSNAGGDSVSVRVNDGLGTFSGTQEVGVGRFPLNVTVGDVDGDSDLDLLSVNSSSGTVSVRVNDGNGTFSGVQEVKVDDDPRSVAVGDMDGDGDLDLLSANVANGTVSVRLNQP